MDVNFELGDLKFVWDSEKAEKNLKKYKIAFEDAARVFLDLSDIPETTEEEFARMKANILRRKNLKIAG
ncbi:MAG: BrnT family toxin [Selenomonadaceae bacterium]|nr:BrnT family toxin [Selenomonadaceae bacterium]